MRTVGCFRFACFPWTQTLRQAQGRGRLGAPTEPFQLTIAGYPPLQMLRKYSYPPCTFVILTKPQAALLWSKRPPRRPLRTCVLTLPKGRGKRSLAIRGHRFVAENGSLGDRQLITTPWLVLPEVPGGRKNPIVTVAIKEDACKP